MNGTATATNHRLRGAFRPGLTEREQQVLKLLADGFSNQMIGSALGISTTTVKNHLATITERIGVYGRSEKAAWWSRQQHG